MNFTSPIKTKLDERYKTERLIDALHNGMFHQTLGKVRDQLQVDLDYPLYNRYWIQISNNIHDSLTIHL